MLVYYFVPFIVSNHYLLFWVSNGHNSVTVQNRTRVYMNFFDHKDLENHLLQLCPKVAEHPVYKCACPTEHIHNVTRDTKSDHKSKKKSYLRGWSCQEFLTLYKTSRFVTVFSTANAYHNETPMSLLFEFTFIYHMWLSVSQHAFNLYPYLWKATYSVSDWCSYCL